MVKLANAYNPVCSLLSQYMGFYLCFFWFFYPEIVKWSVVFIFMRVRKGSLLWQSRQTQLKLILRYPSLYQKSCLWPVISLLGIICIILKTNWISVVNVWAGWTWVNGRRSNDIGLSISLFIWSVTTSVWAWMLKCLLYCFCLCACMCSTLSIYKVMIMCICENSLFVWVCRFWSVIHVCRCICSI